MSQPVAKQGDQVVGVDTHVVMIPSPGGPVPTPLPHPFAGQLDGQLSSTVFVDNKAVATVGSTSSNSPPHVPAGGPFQKPPANRGTVSSGSSSVFIDNKAVARNLDTARTCNDPSDQDTGTVIAVSTVFAP